MRHTDILKLLLLAAIWGGSFIFMRVISPVLGAIITTNSRLLIGGMVLLIYYFFAKVPIGWRDNWKQYLIIGLVNSALPFSLYAYALLHIPASYAVVLNTTTPLFAALFAWIWLGEGMTLKKVTGFIVAAAGVALVVNIGSPEVDGDFLLAVLACLGATACYALAGVYVKKFAGHIKPLGIAAGSQLLAALVLLPISVTQEISGMIDTHVIINLLGLALLSSALAYVLFFQLIANIGPTRAMTVAYLMPVFGMLWASLFLNEAITLPMIAGTALVISGIWLVVQKAVKK